MALRFLSFTKVFFFYNIGILFKNLKEFIQWSFLFFFFYLKRVFWLCLIWSRVRNYSPKLDLKEICHGLHMWPRNMVHGHCTLKQQCSYIIVQTIILQNTIPFNSFTSSIRYCPHVPVCPQCHTAHENMNNIYWTK